METPQNTTTSFFKNKYVRLLGVGCAGLIFFICLCFALALLTNQSPASEPEVQTIPFENPTVVILALTNTVVPAPTQDVGVVGERRESGGIAVTVISVEKMTGIDSFTPGEGNVFLVIEVLIENISRDEETPYNPLYFSVKDSDGFEGSTTFASPDPSLKSGNLPKGDKARGFIAFEVRSNASGFVVTYEPLVLFGGYKPIRISLGQ